LAGSTTLDLGSHRFALDFGGQRFCSSTGFRLVMGLSFALGAGLVQSSSVSRCRQTAREKEIAGVPVRNLMDLVLLADGFHILFQNDFHIVYPPIISVLSCRDGICRLRSTVNIN